MLERLRSEEEHTRRPTDSWGVSETPVVERSESPGVLDEPPQYLTHFTAEDAESRRERKNKVFFALRFSALSAVKKNIYHKKCDECWLGYHYQA